MSPFIVLDYIKTTIEILINLKFEETGVNKAPNVNTPSTTSVETDDLAKVYETMIQKMEAESRNHIMVSLTAK